MRVFRPLAVICCAIVSLAFAAAHAETVLKNAELLEKSGIAHQINELPAAMAGALEQARQEGVPVDEKLGNAWRNVTPIAFKPEKLLARMDAGLDKLLSENEKRELLAHFNSPLGQKITSAENKATTPEAIARIAALAQDPSSFASRAALYKELDDATNATPAMINMVNNMSVALQAGMASAADGPDKVDINALKAEVEKEQANIAQQMQAQVAATFAYCYEGLSADEMASFLKFVRSPTGQKFNRGLVDLTSEAFTVQTKELGQLLYKAFETGQPG